MLLRPQKGTIPFLSLQGGPQSSSTSMGPPVCDLYPLHKGWIHCICRLVGRIQLLYRYLPTTLGHQNSPNPGTSRLTSGLPSSLSLPFLSPFYCTPSLPFLFAFMLFVANQYAQFRCFDSHENPSSPPRGGLPVYR
ncbi:uncharacterized protein ASPGLDRAFT_1213381 [Aspergillus glaucus CBS 516.65]|uniref:Uncharacterized protein n=1 Tax=Aspergillus glaucus CBS 516.65 TaxID=1160497 RepID=A0A1L9VQV6_ASPGL|nr:hypothetical protein ASPGLDRAFT_1213381 [Aspergillus glaucus CBS 516.65]OJJ86305.1 hypothetical protein ASPGLDRAFT_1213381 [Aspergillus glaucus CBS 516.65]